MSYEFDYGYSQHDLDNEYDEWLNGPEPPLDPRQEAEDAMHDQQEAEIDATDPGCQCDTHGLYTLGSVESIRAGETDPLCTVHGLDEVRNGTFAAWGPAQRSQFLARLHNSLRDA